MNTKSNQPSSLAHPDSWFHRVFIGEAILSILLVLSFIGIAYTDIAGIRSVNFWLWMIPIFALASIILEWSRYIRGEIDGYHFIRQQILHWAAVFITIKIIFILLNMGRLPNNAVSYILMIIISLSTFLAGIYTGWRFIVLGLFLTLETLIAAFLETYVWVLIPIAILIIFIALLFAWREFKALKK